jgi:hypothetical protein
LKDDNDVEKTTTTKSPSKVTTTLMIEIVFTSKKPFMNKIQNIDTF